MALAVSEKNVVDLDERFAWASKESTRFVVEMTVYFLVYSFKLNSFAGSYVSVTACPTYVSVAACPHRASGQIRTTL